MPMAQSSRGGEPVVKAAQRILTDVEIKTLPTLGGLPIGPEIPGGHIWVPIACVLVFFNPDSEYTNIELAEASLTISGFEALGPASTGFSFNGLYDFLAGGFDPLVIVMRPFLRNASVNGADVVTQVRDIDDFDGEAPEPFTPAIEIYNPLGDLTGGHVDNRLSVTISYMEITP